MKKELIEIRKRMMRVLEEECQIQLKNDATLRQYLSGYATSAINRLKKKTEDSPVKND